MSRNCRCHKQTERLVDGPVCVGIGSEHDDGSGDGKEGGHAVVQMSGLAAGISCKGRIGEGAAGDAVGDGRSTHGGGGDLGETEHGLLDGRSVK